MTPAGRGIGWWVAAVCVLPVTAHADYLEVRRTALFKEEPEREGALVTRLDVGDCVEVLDDGAQEGGYYRGALASGDEGWVYRTLVRRWPDGYGPTPDCGATIDTEATSFASSDGDRFVLPTSPWPDGDRSRARELVVCSWNIKWFGKQAPDEYRLDVMADFVEDCDVTAIQEMEGSHRREVLDGLVGTLRDRGLAVDSRLSGSTGYVSNPDSAKRNYVEAHAFVWRTDRVALVAAPSFLSQPPINHPTFRQVPWVADFEVRGGAGFDLRVASVHTVYNDAINVVRRDEIQALADWVVEGADDERDLVAIGDFNANPPGQGDAHWFDQVVTGDEHLRVLVQEGWADGRPTVRTTAPTKDSSASATYHNEPVYDHALIASDRDEALPVQPMLAAEGWVGVWAFDDHPSWDTYGVSRSKRRSMVSDHRPIWIKLDYLAPDLDADAADDE